MSWDAHTHSDTVKRYFWTTKAGKRTNLESWTGILMLDNEQHDLAKWFAKQLRTEGFHARVIVLQDGSIGTTGYGANMVTRTVVMMKDSDIKQHGNHYLIKMAFDMEYTLW